MSSDDWGARVVEALRAYFANGGWLLHPTTLVDTRLDLDPDGTSVVVAVYEHVFYKQRIGLRHRLVTGPMTIPEGFSPEEAMAQDIAVYEISEPLGTYYYRLVEDSSGIWWWKWPMDA
jgi:hypothetical protein